MTTEKQVAANRANALKSTGPRTPEGKETAKMNALRHGLLSREVVMKGEEEADLEELGQRLRLELRPMGEMERILVDRIASSVWRLRRALRVESAVMAQNAADVPTKDYNGRRYPSDDIERRRLRAWIVDDDSEKLVRYETVIERQIYKALRELERLQASRGSEPLRQARAIDAEAAEAQALPAPEGGSEMPEETGSFGESASEKPEK